MYSSNLRWSNPMVWSNHAQLLEVADLCIEHKREPYYVRLLYDIGFMRQPRSEMIPPQRIMKAIKSKESKQFEKCHGR